MFTVIIKIISINLDVLYYCISRLAYRPIVKMVYVWGGVEYLVKIYDQIHYIFKSEYNFATKCHAYFLRAVSW